MAQPPKKTPPQPAPDTSEKTAPPKPAQASPPNGPNTGGAPNKQLHPTGQGQKNNPGQPPKPGGKSGPNGGGQPGPNAGRRPPGPGGEQGRAPQQKKKAQVIEVRPVSVRAAPRRRHWGLLLSFLFFVLLPIGAAGYYLYTYAADQYASTVGFSVRKEESSSALDVLGGLSELGGSSSADTDILYEFIQSQGLVKSIDEKIGLREMYSKPENDPYFAFEAPGSIEDLVDYWERMVKISYDGATGLIELRVHAFEAQDAQDIAQTIFDESSAMINDLSSIAREDTTRYAREELDLSVERLKDAREAITLFRSRTQIVDPNADIAGQVGLLNTLQQQLAMALIELDLIQQTTRQEDPRITQAERRIEVIENRIDQEREKFGVGGVGRSGQDYATLVAEYESLTVDREFAEQAYTSALSAYDAALAEAQRKSRYLAAYVAPTLAETAKYPQREIMMLLGSMFIFMLWAIGVLLFYSLRDRR